MVYATFIVPQAGTIFGGESHQDAFACEEMIIKESVNTLLRRGVEYDLEFSRAQGYQTQKATVEFTFSRPL
jgi:hypothetical protein